MDAEERMFLKAVGRIPQKRWFWIAIGMLFVGALFWICSQSEPDLKGHYQSWPWRATVGKVLIIASLLWAAFALCLELRAINRALDRWEKEQGKDPA